MLVILVGSQTQVEECAKRTADTIIHHGGTDFLWETDAIKREELWEARKVVSPFICPPFFPFYCFTDFFFLTIFLWDFFLYKNLSKKK